MALRIEASTVTAARPPSRWSNKTSLVVRSTNVPTALRPFSPRMRSPSQCPATARLILFESVEIVHHGAEVCLLRDLYEQQLA